MDDLRRMARLALEAEWGDAAERGGLEERVLSRLAPLAPRRAVADWPGLLAASLAAVMVLAVAAEGLHLAGLRSRPAVGPPPVHLAGTPSASPSAGPEPDYGPPPKGVDLLWYVDPRQPGWLVAVDWTGHPRGTLKLQEHVSNLIPSSDGSRLLVTLGTYPQTHSFLDAQGNVLGAPPAEPSMPLWADDNRQVCYATQNLPPSGVGPSILKTLLPGGVPRRVAAFGSSRDSSTAYVLGCSPANDRALVGEYAQSNRNSQLAWLIRLSTGVLMGQFSQPRPFAGSTVTGNPDLAYLASGHASGTPGSGFQDLSILKDGTPVGTVNQVTPLAFSADGGRLLVEGDDNLGGSDFLRLIDWRTGRVVWSLDRSLLPYSDDRLRGPEDVLAGPGGEFAIAFHHADCLDNVPGCSMTGGGGSDILRDVLLVHPDGTAVLAASRVRWFTAPISSGAEPG